MNASGTERMVTADELARAFDRSFAAAPAEQADGRTTDFLVVGLGDGACALRLDQVRGLIASPRITRVPGPAGELLGLTGVRGTIVPVFSLPAVLGRAPTAPAWMTLAGGDELLGLAFESYESLLRAAPGDVSVAADARSGSGWSRAIVRAGERCLPVVDVPGLIDAIFKSTEQTALPKGSRETE